MRRIKRKVIGSFLAVCLLLLGSISTVSAAETFEQIGDVKPSNIAYDVSLSAANIITIFNRDKVDLSIGKRYYLVYTVEEIEDNNMTVSGLYTAEDSANTSPYVTGVLKFSPEKDALLEEGATYFCRVEMTEEGLDYIVAKKGKNDSQWVELYQEEKYKTTNGKYFGIYLYGTTVVNAKLSSVLCYDESGKNLGVNVKTVIGYNSVDKISTVIEDYSLCEAVYWCEKNQTTLILDAEKNIGVQVENSNTDTPWYKYSVRGTTLTMQKGDQEVAYDYYYSYMRDDEGNKYVRLTDTKVTFVTGQKEHEGNQTVAVTAADGYKVKQPTNPTVKGYTFKEWCLSDGAAFNFDKYVTESVTLYASYEDGDGHTYLAVDGELEKEPANALVGRVVFSVVTILFTVVLVLLILKGGKKRATSKN